MGRVLMNRARTRVLNYEPLRRLAVLLHRIYTVRRLWRLGVTLTDRLRLSSFAIRAAVAFASGANPPAAVTVNLRPGHPVTLFDFSEIEVLREVMVNSEYAIDLPAPQTILDLGANVGIATLYLHDRYPHARILAVEADPVTYARLVANTRGLENVETVNVAISDAEGEVSLYRMAWSIGSSIRARGNESTEIRVPSTSIAALMRARDIDHVDLLKLDVEGAEIAALRGMPPDAVERIVGELHFDLVDSDEAELRSLLPGWHVALAPIGLPGRYHFDATREPAGRTVPVP
jgi:FkbM family methyltransferase